MWLALFLIMIVRLTKSCIAGAQLVAQAEPLHDEAIDNAMRIAEGRLGIRQSHQTRVSASIRCPVIWCWGRKPSILLPHSMLDHSSSSLRAVLCHELAHSKRRDHLGSFMVEFATCLLAWHPLMWIARRLASDANEQACDAWVLSTGASATNYADTLLSLIPQPASSIVLAAVHSRPALKRRIVHILGDTQASPTSGSRFLFVAVILFLVLGANASLAQRRSMDSTIANSGDRNAALPADLVAMYPIDANDPRFESMHVLPAELDLGFTDAAQAKTGSVWLVNRTQNPITVLGAKASCGCTTIEDIRDTVIAPGSSLQVEINIEPGTVPGQRKTKHVTFQFEGLDPIKIPVHVTVRDTTN
ncbi:MAG: DUF1573 domain-containing protein [Planctomycetota bacterium]|nr:DUF1573 domain-containing protein [Planctomycetota bacterium]